MNITGSKDITANNASMPIEVQDSMSLDDVSWCNVVPACIAINVGGITPKMKNIGLWFIIFIALLNSRPDVKLFQNVDLYITNNFCG